ncbi:MAG: D-aminoacylase [Actinobacteria bacterium]|nr:D-aminoacylase [Actinomycetota bacterium]
MSTHDLVIANGRIVDGCGNPWYHGDVAVRGDRIVAIGAAGALRGRAVIDADGRYITPGFVDPHTHSDISILQYPRADSVVRQGVTTHVTGNCGMSPAPLGAAHRDEALHNWAHYWDISGVAWDWTSFRQYLKVLELAGGAINIAPLVGHGALRLAVMGLAERAVTARELVSMERLLDAALRAGAHGLSTGLVYPPGCFSDTEELVRLCRVVARHHGIYTTHVRGERETILEAVAEAIEIGRRAGVPVQVSHNVPKWGAPEGAAANLALIEAARREDLDVTTDSDVHTDLAPRLSRALPQPVLDLGHDALIALLSDRSRRAELRRAVVEDVLPGAGYAGLVRHGRFDRLVIFQAGRHPELRGRSVADIAAERAADPFDTYLDLIVEEDDQIVGLFDYMEEKNIRALLCSPLSMVSSDGLVMPPADELDDPALYWPCSYGEYPGILERYVRDEPVLRLEEAIRKMTSFPAQRFGLLDRGVLRPGLRADLVVFDLDKVRDRATNLYPHTYPFTNIPHRHAEGFDWVIVNGRPVIAEGEHTGTLPGRVLRRR